MNTLDPHPSLGKIRLLLITAVVLAPQILFAQWNATIGAQTTDKGRQALAFLPNEIWIHAGDKITWTFATDEPHTLTFLTENQVRNPFNVGCPGYSPDNSPFDGSTCVSTPPMFHGQTFTVIFPKAGNYKFACLFHENMTGAVHVLAASEPLPHDQAFYDTESRLDRRSLIAATDDTGHLVGHGSGNDVIAGVGRVVATTGGSHTVSILRFMQKQVTIHVGDTVEWGNDDPITPHTITFGEEPQDLIPPSPNVTVDSDGRTPCRDQLESRQCPLRLHPGFSAGSDWPPTISARGHSLPDNLHQTRRLSLHLRPARRSGDEREHRSPALDHLDQFSVPL